MEEEMKNSGNSKLVIIIVVIILLLAVSAGGVWYFFLKKSAEGGACKSDARCETGLTCVNKICSSGKAGSVCSAKTDCKTDYCVNGKCSGGKVADVCATYKDCDTGLLCQKGACAIPPDYTKYFSNVILSKMKPGLPPGATNPLTVTATFTTTDAIEIDFRGVKSTTVGSYYVEFINSTTGEVARSTQNEMVTKFEGRDGGMGTDMGGMKVGQYDLNIYFNNELVYTTQITVIN